MSKETKNQRIGIWGTGREGLAVFEYLKEMHPTASFVFLDEARGAETIEIATHPYPVKRNQCAIEETLCHSDLLVLSPGVSLYHPFLKKTKNKHLKITSLLNIWRSEHPNAFVIGVTGTKGKSTTSTLLAHVLTALGKKAVICGNIGIPLSRKIGNDPATDYIILEMSSYQAASFSGYCQIGVLTSLFPEHLDWHKTLKNYYKDKCRFILRCREKIINKQAFPLLKKNRITFHHQSLYNSLRSWHIQNGQIYKGRHLMGTLENDFLLRAHNCQNVCAVLSVIEKLGLDHSQAILSMRTYQGLPHRQQELGRLDTRLFVNDSISTTPQSTIAALETYQAQSVTLILGGYDRGIDYEPLIHHLKLTKMSGIICLGISGARIKERLYQEHVPSVFSASSMEEAVTIAKNVTPPQGTILLSPAAPSFGLFSDYRERGQAFAIACGFSKEILF